MKGLVSPTGYTGCNLTKEDSTPYSERMVADRRLSAGKEAFVSGITRRQDTVALNGQ